MEESLQQSDGTLHGQFDTITAPTHIHSLLQRLVQERLFVTVTLPQHKDVNFNSTVLELDLHNAQLILDELYPEQGQKMLTQGSSLRIYARLDEMTALYFDTTVSAIGDEEGMLYYQLSIPRQVRYLQRRADYRVPVDRLEKVPVTLRLADGRSFLGQLHDLSNGGGSVLLHKDSAGGVEKGAVFKACQLELPKEQPLSCAADLRWIRDWHDGKHVLLGLRFNFVDPRVKQRMVKLVHRLERELLRQRYVH